MGREELRFKSFSERVASISIDVIHRVNRGHQYSVGPTETHFREALDKWFELNCTREFTEVVELVGPDVQTLPQLLHAKDGIFKLLQQQLGQKQLSSLDALLELVVALARDLQDQFYPQFATFFTVITSTHLQKRDADVLEKVFTCLAYLFKFQWRFMVNDIKAVFDLYVPLLSEQQKDYTKTFAAESFAFLLRKVPDKTRLLDLIFSHADQDSSLAHGLGVLFFEMLKGVKTRVHSCADHVFPLVMRRLACRGGDSTDTRLLVIRTMLELLCDHLTPDYSAFLFDTLTDCLLSSGELTPSHFAALCQCYEAVISFKDGKLASLKPNDVCATFKKAFSHCPEEAFSHLLDATALVLNMCEKRGATEASVVAVLEAFCESKQNVEEDTLAEFMGKLDKLHCFHKTVVPILWRYCEQREVRTALRLLSKLESLAATKIDCSANLVQWKPLAYLQTVKHSHLAEHIFAALKLTKRTVKVVEDLERFWESCCLVRHLQNLWNRTEIVDQLQKSLKTLTKQQCTDQLHIACVQECVRSLAALKASVDPFQLMPLLRRNKDPFMLRSFDLAIHSSGEERFALQSELFDELWWQLASPYAIVRFLTLCILSQFEPPEEDVPKGKLAPCRYMLTLEGIPVTLHEFRNRNNVMEKLKFNIVLKSALEPKMCRCTLAFLFGQLYINFSQLWTTVKNIIVTYTDYEKFWEIADRQLDETTKAIVGEEHRIAMPTPNEVVNPVLFELLTVEETYENVDYDLHRVFMWNIFEEVHDSAVVSDVPYKYFVSMYEVEFRPLTEFISSENVVKQELLDDGVTEMDVDDVYDDESNQKMAASDSITIDDDDDLIVIEDDSAHESDDVRPEDSASVAGDIACRKSMTKVKYGIKARAGKVAGSSRKCSTALKAALSALARCELKQIQPDKLKELEERFRDLLMFPEAALQKLALECLLACGISILHSCRENLMKLLDDREWMSVLNECFLASDKSPLHHQEKQGKAKKENSVQRIPDKQRKNVLPYVMRLLFGRMLTKKTGHRSKSRVVSKHAAVLRFLASSRESDLMYFIELVLLPLQRYNISVEDDNDVSTEHLLAKVAFDPENAMPVRRVRQVLSNIRHVLNHMAGVLPKFLPLLLRSVLLLLRYSSLVVEQAANVNRLYLLSIKKARLFCADIVFQYFSHFNHFAMSLADVHLFFELYIWRTLQALVVNPSGDTARVFRLVSCFASKERLQFLLGLKSRDDPTRTIMTDLMAILGTSSAAENVVKTIRNIVKLLLSDPEPDQNAAQIIYSVKDIDLHDNTEPSLGFRIAMPFTFVILSRPLKQMKESGRPMGPVDRFILYRLSKYNTDPTLASNILNLTVSTFLHKRVQKNEEDTSEHETLCIIRDLMEVADTVEDLFLPLSRLWTVVQGRTSRDVLLDVFKKLSTKISGIDSEVCSIIKKVNSWDSKLAEEPDYLQRIKGFQDIVMLIEAMKVPEVRSALPLIHNCIYTSSRSSDLSLRDAATYAIFKIVTFCHDVVSERHEEFFRTCVELEIYGGVKKGLKSSDETTRHESLKILTHILSTCGERQLFEELKSFQDSEKEKDFFECIAHVQIHRRARALNRLSSVLATRHVSPRIILDVFLPLTEPFLLSDVYSKQNISEAAIENLGALARKLPWQNYVRLLSKYISTLSNKRLCSTKFNQKCMVKIVVTLLDAFHFDLSQLVSVFEETATEMTAGRLSITDRLALPAPDVPISLEAPMDVDAEEREEDEVGEILPERERQQQNDVLPPDGTITVVDVKVGKEILRTLKEMLLTRLQSEIVRKSYYSPEDEDNETGENNDVLRVPIAVAIVKLLSLLPSKTFLERNLPSVLLRVIVFLKSRLLPVREAARSALVKIIAILGPCYLKYMIREMRSLLNRGFQLHVLSFTVHAVLETARPQMQPGDLDECTDDILEICLEEQFGEVADEKDVAGITAKTDEARRTKSLDMFRIVAAVVSEDQLNRVLRAIEEKLLAGNSSRIVGKCEKILEQLIAGLEANKGLSQKAIFMFSYKLLSQNTIRLSINDPALSKQIGNEKETDTNDVIFSEADQTTTHYERPNVFLVPKPPVRGAAETLVSSKVNVHVLIGAALKLLRDILRKNRGQEMNKHLNMLDPFVVLLCQLQRCSYVKVSTLTMVVLQQLLHYPLPAFEEHLDTIVASSMSIIHKYLGTTQKSGSNYDLLIAAFKTIRAVLNDVNNADLNEDQYKMLLTYIETDICDVERQGVAFSLLSSIIDKGINLPELHSLMKKVADMSIQEQVTAIRNQARTVYQKYLFDYPIEPKLREKCVAFYLGQLEYLIEEGRQSAAEMVYQIIKLYPENLLEKSALLFFVPLSARLVNDESVTMRKMCYSCLKTLLEKLRDNSRTSLYALVKKWLQDSSKVQKQFLGAQVIGCFTEVEKEKFASRADEMMDIFIPLIQPKPDSDQMELEDEGEERQRDRLVYLVLNSTVKILTHVRLLESDTPAHRAICSALMSACQGHLLHPHSWVRVAAAQLFGLLFASHDPRELAQAICRREKTTNSERTTVEEAWLTRGGQHLIDELLVSFLEQFQSRLVPTDLLDQLIKNLLFVGKVLLYLDEEVSTDVVEEPRTRIENASANEETDGEGADQDETELQIPKENSKHRTLRWFLFKIEKELRVLKGNFRTPNYEKRTYLYKLLAALALECPREVIQRYSHNFLRPLVRDLEDTAERKDENFCQLVKEVSHVIRREMGFDHYQEGYARQLTELARLKAHRKQTKAVERLLNPEVDLERRERRKKSEKINKKRALDERRGKVKSKVSRCEGDEVARVNREAENGTF
ncbi:small subunit processome component 20-like [Tropilaelaps mercedesae]|uniref:Small subunit processome component 20-like n=1 Tax=Tropilaelaps mercedesae TaxID=418985 RepID=A0A1V9XN21_9ACAR|nr:small subunit processome component 20-like [Tropilaelaps mercedesae]